MYVNANNLIMYMKTQNENIKKNAKSYNEDHFETVAEASRGVRFFKAHYLNLFILHF